MLKISPWILGCPVSYAGSVMSRCFIFEKLKNSNVIDIMGYKLIKSRVILLVQ